MCWTSGHDRGPSVGLVNLLRGVGKLGRIWCECGLPEMRYPESIMNKDTFFFSFPVALRPNAGHGLLNSSGL